MKPIYKILAPDGEPQGIGPAPVPTGGVVLSAEQFQELLDKKKEKKEEKEKPPGLLFLRSPAPPSKSDLEFFATQLRREGHPKEAAELLGKSYDTGLLASFGAKMDEGITWGGAAKVTLLVGGVILIDELWLAEAMGWRRPSEIFRSLATGKK